MRLYTTYFAQIHKLPLNITPISISRYQPYRFSLPTIKILAPSYELLMDYKENKDQEKYIENYVKQIQNVDFAQVLDDIYDLSRGGDAALICWEKYDKFCHRFILSKVFKHMGILVPEYGISDFEATDI